jgi:hypothetical protein
MEWAKPEPRNTGGLNNHEIVDNQKATNYEEI